MPKLPCCLGLGEGPETQDLVPFGNINILGYVSF